MPTGFERSAREFAKELGDALTGTITRARIRCQFVEGLDRAVLTLLPPQDDPSARYVELQNGCWIRIYQRIQPNKDDSRKVSTARYSYAYSLGSDPDKDWLIRYDYVPDKEHDETHPYPVSHVHVNAKNKDYDRFMTEVVGKKQPLSAIHFPTERISLEQFIRHLIVEFQVPLLHGKTDKDARKVLNEGQERFRVNRTR